MNFPLIMDEIYFYKKGNHFLEVTRLQHIHSVRNLPVTSFALLYVTCNLLRCALAKTMRLTKIVNGPML